MTEQKQPETLPRRHDLDWIRVLAMGCLMLFHCGMLFVAEWDWHIQNAERSNLYLEWMFFMSGWRMSLLFIVAGAATYFALRRRSLMQYCQERGLRLLLPLLFGMLVVVPPQIYLERVLNGQFDGHYGQFWLTVFQLQPYPAGNFSWHHLWFVFYLFLFSLLAAPWFKYVAHRLNGWWDWLAVRPKTMLLVFGGLYALLYAVFTIPFPGPQNLIDDWGRFFSYFSLFVFGYLWFTHEAMGHTLFKLRHLAIKLSLLTLIVVDYMRWNDLEPAWELAPPQIAFMMLRGFSGFCFAVALLGYARQFLNHGSAFLRYANEAVYPFYILHQTVIIIIGYQVIHLGDTISDKFVFTVVVSFVVTLTLYECLVRPWPWMRVLMGMKPKTSN